MAAPAATTAPASGSSAASLNDEDWSRLEADLRQRISKQVLSRIDFVLDHRIRSSITEVVDAAIDGLAADIKRGLHQTLEEIIARAVSQEIARIQSSKD